MTKFPHSFYILSGKAWRAFMLFCVFFLIFCHNSIDAEDISDGNSVKYHSKMKKYFINLQLNFSDTRYPSKNYRFEGTIFDFEGWQSVPETLDISGDLVYLGQKRRKRFNFNTSNPTEGYIFQGKNCSGLNYTQENTWIAVVNGPNCDRAEIYDIVVRENNASALIMNFDYNKDTYISFEFGRRPIIQLPVIDRVAFSQTMNNSKVPLTVRLRYNSYLAEHHMISQASLLFVVVSFVLLFGVSLAWVVFYYIHQIRHSTAKDFLAKRLYNAAKKTLPMIPVKVLGPSNISLDTESDQCAVCIETFQLTDEIRILPCRHAFHRLCIDPWLLQQRNCPMCKLDILEAYGMTKKIGNAPSVLRGFPSTFASLLTHTDDYSNENSRLYSRIDLQQGSSFPYQSRNTSLGRTVHYFPERMNRARRNLYMYWDSTKRPHLNAHTVDNNYLEMSPIDPMGVSAVNGFRNCVSLKDRVKHGLRKLPSKLSFGQRQTVDMPPSAGRGCVSLLGRIGEGYGGEATAELGYLTRKVVHYSDSEGTCSCPYSCSCTSDDCSLSSSEQRSLDLHIDPGNKESVCRIETAQLHANSQHFTSSGPVIDNKITNTSCQKPCNSFEGGLQQKALKLDPTP